MASDVEFSAFAAWLAAEDDQAAAFLWNSYAQRLISLARKNLSARIRQKEDPEDVVQSALKSFYRRHADNEFRLDDWDNLWAILVIIVLRKCRDRVRRFHSQGRDLNREQSLNDTGEALPASAEPTPLEAAALADLVAYLLAALEPGDREVVVLTLQGYSATEVAPQVGRTRRTVSRVLKRVRGTLLKIVATENS